MKLCKICKQQNDRKKSTCSYECEVKAVKIRQEAQKARNKARKRAEARLPYTKAKLDKLWSKIVSYHGRCIYCGKTTSLNAHHIYSRSNHAIRWDLENGVCLCAGCHTFSTSFSAHKTPTEFTEFIIDRYGHELLDDLKRKKLLLKQKTNEEWYKYLKEAENQLTFNR